MLYQPSDTTLRSKILPPVLKKHAEKFVPLMHDTLAKGILWCRELPVAVAAQWFAVYCFFLTAALLIQVQSGSFESELAHWPDEPAHVTTSLMVHDYLAGRRYRDPIGFAETYYSHYPKVAIGIWPPFYYFCSALWMLAFGVSSKALLVLNAATTAALATIVGLLSQRITGGNVAALFAGTALLALPEIQYGASIFMLDIPVALLQLLAALFLAEYFLTQTLKHAVLFGLTASAALLTKGNASALALLLPLMLMMTRQWPVLKRIGPYVALGIVVLAGLPWQFVSLRFIQTAGLPLDLSAARIATAVTDYSALLVRDASVVVLAVSGIGAISRCFLRPKASRRSTLTAVGVTSTLIATLIFHSIVPTYPDGRYLVTAYACLSALLYSGVLVIVGDDRLFSVRSRVLAVIVTVGVVAGFGAQSFKSPRFYSLGFSDVASHLHATGKATDRILICSDANGEGALIVEVAMRDQARPSRTILRSSKLLSENRWSESEYRPRFQSSRQLATYLQGASIDAVVVDYSFAMWEQDRTTLLDAVKQMGSTWRITYHQLPEAGRRHLVVFRRTNPHNSSTGIAVPLTHRLADTLRSA